MPVKVRQQHHVYDAVARLLHAHHFTGKERDAESGPDYFGARYYGSALGRFSSPDEPLADQYVGDPQSWNLYGYVRNNPLRSVDPDGRTCTFAKTSGGADIITDADGKGCAELHDNTVHAYDEAGIAMLASIGVKLTDPHEARLYAAPLLLRAGSKSQVSTILALRGSATLTVSKRNKP